MQNPTCEDASKMPGPATLIGQTLPTRSESAPVRLSGGGNHEDTEGVGEGEHKVTFTHDGDEYSEDSGDEEDAYDDAQPVQGSLKMMKIPENREET